MYEQCQYTHKLKLWSVVMQTDGSSYMAKIESKKKECRVIYMSICA